MKAQIVGRTLGIGLRLAGRVASQTVIAGVEAASSNPAPQSARPRPANLVRGVGGFLRPFRRIGGILWLEVTGVLFLLPATLFAPYLWRSRASYAHGPDHRSFVVSAVTVAVFLYLGISSFWRARRK